MAKIVSVELTAQSSSFSANMEKGEQALHHFSATADGMGEKLKGTFEGLPNLLSGGGFESSLQGLSGGLTSVAGSAEEMISGFGPAGAIVGTFAIGAAAATAASVGLVIGVKSLIEPSLEAAENAERLSKSLNIDPTALTGLESAFKAYEGISPEETNEAFEKLAKNLGKVDEEGGKLGELFVKMGLNAKQLSGQRLDVSLLQIADGMTRLKNATDQEYVASELFGKGVGAHLLPALQQGSAGLQKFIQDAKGWGTALSGADLSKMAEAQEQINVLSEKFEGLKNQLAIALVPVITEVTDAISGMIPAPERMREVFEQAITVVEAKFHEWLPTIQMAWEGLKTLGSVAEEVASVVGMVVTPSSIKYLVEGAAAVLALQVAYKTVKGGILGVVSVYGDLSKVVSFTTGLFRAEAAAATTAAVAEEAAAAATVTAAGSAGLFGAAIAAWPIALIVAGVAAFEYGMGKLGSYMTDDYAATKAHNAAIKEAADTYNSYSDAITSAGDAFQKAKKDLNDSSPEAQAKKQVEDTLSPQAKAVEDARAALEAEKANWEAARDKEKERIDLGQTKDGVGEERKLSDQYQQIEKDTDSLANAQRNLDAVSNAYWANQAQNYDDWLKSQYEAPETKDLNNKAFVKLKDAATDAAAAQTVIADIGKNPNLAGFNLNLEDTKKLAEAIQSKASEQSIFKFAQTLHTFEVNEKAKKDLDEMQKKAVETANKIKALQNDIGASKLGMSKEEYELRQAGDNRDADYLVSLKAQKAALEDVNKLLDKSDSPFEKWENHLNNIQKLLDSGVLSIDRYKQAVKAAEDEYKKSEDTQNKKLEREIPRDINVGTETRRFSGLDISTSSGMDALTQNQQLQIGQSVLTNQWLSQLYSLAQTNGFASLVGL